MNKIDNPIFVTGTSRSGTSMLAGILDICGVFGGTVTKPKHDSARGMWENDLIHDSIVKPYMESIGVDVFGQYPLPETNNLIIPNDWAGRVKQCVCDDGYENGKWFYKSNKLTLLWPIWEFAFPNAKWLIVRRRTGDILESCLKTSFMRAFKGGRNWEKIGVSNEREAWLWWVHEYEKRFVDMMTYGLNCRVIWPERMVHGDYVQLFETIEWLGLEWNSKILGYIDPKFWKVRRGEKNGL